MRKLITGVFLFLCAVSVLPAQDDSEWYLDKPIADITFTGLSSVSKNDLEGVVKSYIGQKFTDSLFWDLQSKLYALDYFEQITPKALPGNPDKSIVIIEFEVTERPLVDAIEFIGNSRVRRSELLETILLKKGDMVTKAKIQVDEAAIRDKYLEKGFPDIQVTGEMKEPEGGKGAVVAFTVVEGEQTTIREIRFSGNTFAAGNTLKGVLKSKEQSLFSSGVFQENNVAQDKELLREYYVSRGFVDAAVTDVKTDVLADEKDGRKYLALTYYLDEGKQYTFGGITFEGNKIFSDEQLQDRMRLAPGRLLDMTKLQADIRRVADLYYENGYIFNTFSDRETRNETDNTISYTIEIGEKDRAHIENLILKGNEKTKNEVILREIPLEPGDLFSTRKITQGAMNLLNLQYFSAVRPEPVYGSAEGLMDLVINLEEQNTADIKFGLSFSGNTEFPIAAYVNLSDRNFLGRGQTLGGEINLSPIQQSLSFNFLENWLFDRRWSGGINFTINHRQVSDISQDIEGPVFSPGDPNAVPDPFTGEYVFTEELTTYNGDEYKAGVGFPDNPPTAEQIEQYNLKTDYAYALSNGETIPPENLMKYESFDFSLGGTTGYEFKLPVGSIITSTGLSTTLSYIKYDPQSFRPFNEEIRTNLDDWLFINKFSLSLAWDARDYRFNPQKGFLLSQRFTYAGGILGGSQDYIRTSTKAEGYLKLLDIPVSESWSFKTVLAAHSGISFVLPQFGASDPVISEGDLLIIDGMTTARGWRQSISGEALWENWVELRFPISEQLLWFDLFLDAAALWETPEDMKGIGLHDFYFSAGADLRITMPNFPIRFGLAKLFRFDENGSFVSGPGDLFGGLGLQFVISLSTSLY